MSRASAFRGTRFFITGHSQDGAIATLVRSFLEHRPVGGLTGERYKTYVTLARLVERASVRYW